ncbi:hypothetical protein D3C86_517940 [compost metagenome]
MVRISGGIARYHQGERQEARRLFAQIWDEIAPNGDPFHRCTLAHFMADLQEDPHDELAWDLRALEAADSLTDDRVKEHHAAMELRSFYPSLHLNLAEDYRKLGDRERASEHLSRAQESVEPLPDEGFANFIRMGIARLRERLAEERDA